MDIALNETGIIQAGDVANKLKDKEIDLILSSDLRRAKETAEVLAKKIKKPLLFATELKEVKLGDMEGMPFVELDRLLGEGSFKRWLGVDPRDDEMRFPNGESKKEVQKRATEFLYKFMETFDGNNLAVATHGFLIIRLLVAIDKNFKDGYIIPNGKIFHFTYHSNKSFKYVGQF